MVPMANPLVATKLFVPKPRRDVVQRSRLREKLEQGASSRLTLISAPAGFGKTTLLAEWLAARQLARAVAWLSLDQTDNEPTSFWTHVIVALGQAAGDVAGSLLPILEAGQQPVESVLTSLVNALSASQQPIDLVLDDFHVIDHPGVQAGVAFLLEHLPSHVHLVISTRADPALPLARLRARGELVEIRSADLRFTAGETAAYLNGMMGLDLAAHDIAALEGRTEGWIAALQLAALSMRGRNDVASFIESFAGNDRYIVDYLVEEVLQRQTDEVRKFLLQTCFLDRLSGSLCDAVMDRSGSKAVLDGLNRANLFLVPLDDHREWYRYHHLFADVLFTQLGDEALRELPVLHRRASDWYERHGDRSEAIRHALAAGGFERAAELIELAIPQLRRERNHLALRRWIMALPDAMVRARPVLGVAIVGVLLSGGELEGVQERLRDAEQNVEALSTLGAAASGVVVVDHGQFAGVPAQIALYRTALAQIGGDVPGTIAHARRAFDLAPADDDFGRAGAAGFLGIAYWTAGDLEAARRWWTQCAGGLQRTGHIADVLGVARALADILAAEGRLGDAVRACENALRLQGDGVLRGAADLYVRLGEFCRERNDLQGARDHLSRAQELGELAALPQYPHRLRVGLACASRDGGDLGAALDLLDDAERRYASDFFPDVRPIAAIRARVWIAQGRLDEAVRWAKASGVTGSDELSYLREFDHITLARLMLAKRAGGDAAALLDRLLVAAEGGGRTRSVIEIAMLIGLAHQQGDVALALASLERALTLAEPEGFVRLFVDEGPAMEALLRLAVKRRVAVPFARKLLAAFGPAVEEPRAHPDLIEPLSERELDVLRLLRTDLGGPEIARELALSLNTVRTHTKAIYEKLSVNNRRAAVRRAEEFSLLRSGGR